MNVNQLVNMFVRIVVRRLMNGGVNAGINAVSKRKSRGETDTPENAATGPAGDAHHAPFRKVLSAGTQTARKCLLSFRPCP